MLKVYVDRSGSGINPVTKSVTAVNAADLHTGYMLDLDGLIDRIEDCIERFLSFIPRNTKAFHPSCV